MTPNQKAVLAAITPLIGKTYQSKEDLDDAFFPIYGPLQNIFHGEGHRDLVDRLIAAKWITRDQNGYKVVATGDAPSEKLTFAEAQMIVQISNASGVKLEDIGNPPLAESLISRGILYKTGALDKSIRDSHLREIAAASQRAKDAIDQQQFESASNALEVAIRHQKLLTESDFMTYDLTPHGLNVLSKLQETNISF